MGGVGIVRGHQCGNSVEICHGGRHLFFRSECLILGDAEVAGRRAERSVQSDESVAQSEFTYVAPLLGLGKVYAMTRTCKTLTLTGDGVSGDARTSRLLLMVLRHFVVEDEGHLPEVNHAHTRAFVL